MITIKPYILLTKRLNVFLMNLYQIDNNYEVRNDLCRIYFRNIIMKEFYLGFYVFRKGIFSGFLISKTHDCTSAVLFI